MQYCWYRGTAKQNQARGQKSVFLSLPWWETMQHNKWPSTSLHRVGSKSLHSRLFLRAEHIEPKWAAGQKVCGALSLWVTIQSLDLLNRKEKGTEPGKIPGARHTDMQRSRGLWLTRLLWTAYKKAAIVKIMWNSSKDRLLHHPAVFFVFLI